MISEYVSLPIVLDNGTPRFTDRILWPHDWNRISEFAPNDPIRAIERASIRTYMELHRDKLKGRVLDFGCGKQPYKDLVDGEYIPYDPDPQYGAYVLFDPKAPTAMNCPVVRSNDLDVILCNQVLQYEKYQDDRICDFYGWLKRGGFLICTYPSNWDEVENTDLIRLTKSGMESLLGVNFGFEILDHTRRAEVRIGNFCFPLGYGVAAQKK